MNNTRLILSDIGCQLDQLHHLLQLLSEVQEDNLEILEPIHDNALVKYFCNRNELADTLLVAVFDKLIAIKEMAIPPTQEAQSGETEKG